MSLIIVFNTSFAISYLLVFSSKPSNDIKLSLPQSKNHGYPAIIVCSLNDGLYAINVSADITKFFISSCLFSSSSVLSCFSEKSISVFSKIFDILCFSFIINFFTSNSSMFSSNEHTNEISFSSFGFISISYLPTTA